MINARSRDALREGRSGQCKSKSDAAACKQNCGRRGGGFKGGDGGEERGASHTFIKVDE